jgi:hypothetical protein
MSVGVALAAFSQYGTDVTAGSTLPRDGDAIGL